jgi:hypothetical protein
MLLQVARLLVNTAHFRGYLSVPCGSRETHVCPIFKFSGLQAEDEVSAFPGRSTDLPIAALNAWLETMKKAAY